MPLTLRWLEATTLRVEGAALRPDRPAIGAAEAARLAIPVGNGLAELGELFAIEGDGSDGTWIVEGDVRSVRGIGSGMAAGRLELRGPAGDGLGEQMAGGSIVARRSAGRWLGAEMAGGTIRAEGDVGDDAGSALPGSRVGMRGGEIHVLGSIGADAGLAMRRGLIAIGGAAGPGLGRSIVAGSIVAFGPVRPQAGWGMKRGTIGLFGLDDPAAPGLGPTFEPSGGFRPHVLPILLSHLAAGGFPVPAGAFGRPIRRYNGDRLEGGRGEIWVAS